MIWSTPPGPPSGRPAARVTPLRAVPAASGLALMAALGACSADLVDESGDAGAVPTYADGSTEQTDTSSRSDSGGDSGDDGGGDSGVIPADEEQQTAVGDVVVTYWHWNSDAGAVEAAGFVDALVEDGGTCTLTLTRGATVLSREGPALSDANTTSCGLLGVPVPGGNGGDWAAVLSYESPTGQGGSEPFKVTVP